MFSNVTVNIKVIWKINSQVKPRRLKQPSPVLYSNKVFGLCCFPRLLFILIAFPAVLFREKRRFAVSKTKSNELFRRSLPAPVRPAGSLMSSVSRLSFHFKWAPFRSRHWLESPPPWLAGKYGPATPCQSANQAAVTWRFVLTQG